MNIKLTLARRRPFRWLWRLKATILIHRLQHDGWTWWRDWCYSESLASYMDECDEYLSPVDAIYEDRQYWESE